MMLNEKLGDHQIYYKTILRRKKTHHDDQSNGYCDISHKITNFNLLVALE